LVSVERCGSNAEQQQSGQVNLCCFVISGVSSTLLESVQLRFPGQRGDGESDAMDIDFVMANFGNIPYGTTLR
jgi:hypothetical protein